MTLFDKLKGYAHGVRVLVEWLGSGGETVEKGRAQDRADICKICPHNQAGLEIPEETSDAIREQVEVKNHLQLRVDGEKSLHTCSLCLCPLKLKIWLPIHRIKPAEDEIDKFPLACWLRKEQV